MNKYRSRGTLVFLYLLSQQGLFLFLASLLMGYCCFFFYDSGEVPFGRGSGSIYLYKSTDPFLFWPVWLFFFACFLALCGLYIDCFYKGTRRITELRGKPYS